MNSKDKDEFYWDSSDNTGFSFDDEVEPVSSLFDSSREAIGGKKYSSVTGPSFGDALEPRTAIKPLESLVSKKTLVIICNVETPTLIKGTPDRQKFLESLLSSSGAQNVGKTIQSIILGEPYFLDNYRSLSSKTQLLEEAVKSGDGNAILNVVLFLRNTLKKKLFSRLLQSKAPAIAVYINYLTTRYEVRTVLDTLLLLGLPRDAAMKDFQFLIKPRQSLESRAHNLRSLSRDHFSTPDIEDKIFVDKFRKFVEWQQENKLIAGTPAQALHCLCSTHWKDDSSSALSPHWLYSSLNMSERHLHLIAIKSLAANGAFKEIEAFLLTQGWFGQKKLKTVIAPEKIIVELHKHQAPEHILAEYLVMVDSLEKRLDLARKLSLHKAVIDTYVAMKDRQGLIQYKNLIQHKLPSSFTWEEIDLTTSSSTRWKN